MSFANDFRLIAAFASCAALGLEAHSGVLDPDTRYGTQGQVTFSTGAAATYIANTVGHSVLQPDGKLIVTGERTLSTFGSRNPKQQFVRRFNPDGTPDLAFGQSGETVFTVRDSDQVNIVAVPRFYNGHATSNDSNHRYTTDAAVQQQMRALGWIDEGIVFCAPKD